MGTKIGHALWLALALPTLACGEQGDGGSIYSVGEPGGSGPGESGDDTSEADASGDEPLLDLTTSGTAEAGTDGDGFGCQKVDFLFVVDNSSSMLAHQEALASSFPGFITAIEERVETNDFHIMVVDTDSRADQNDGCGECHDRCVLGITKDCGFSAPDECEGVACAAIDPEEPDDCDYVLGAGVTDDRWQHSCGLDTADRYIHGGQSDLDATFSCIGTTGVSGTGKELPMGAMVEAVQMSGPDECNEGFIRDDAILVVMILSDGLYAGEANNPPQPWYDALVAAKGGAPENIVVLALLRNEPSEVPGPGCQLGASVCGDGGGWSNCHTNYDEFVELFDERGFMHSICIDNYEPFFSSTLDAIELVCDEFVPVE